MTSRRFTVGIPAYKGKYLNDCISSILNQTYKEYQLVIVNDCSPDDIDGIVNQFSDKRIEYYKNEYNIGSQSIVKSWNKCLELASGEYFILMADDDRMEPNYLEEFNKLINKYVNVNVYHCRSKIIDEQSMPIMLSPLCNENESVYEIIWHRIMHYRHQYISNCVYKTSYLKEAGGFVELPLAWGSDELTLYLAAKNNGIAYTKLPLFCYRISLISITSTGSYKKKIMAINTLEKILLNILVDKPDNIDDSIIRDNIISYIPTYIRKTKIELIAIEMRTKLIRTFISAIYNCNKYKMNKKDVLLAIITYLKYIVVHNYKIRKY